MLAALVIYFVAGIRIDFVTLPVVGMIDLRWFSLPLTLLWILAITDAVNLIDGFGWFSIRRIHYWINHDWYYRVFFPTC